MKTSHSALRRYRRRLASIGAVVAALVLPMGVAAPAMAAEGPNLVVNGNFAEPPIADGDPEEYHVGSIPGWQGPFIDLINDEHMTPPAGSTAGTQSIDLNSDGPSYIEQTVPTEPGKTYTLSFDLAGNPLQGPDMKSGFVYIDGHSAGLLDFPTTGRSPTDMGWVTKWYTFTATDTATVIRFASTTTYDAPDPETDSQAGPMITNVSVVATPDAGVPMVNWQIGGAALLGLMALLGIGAVVRRRSVAVA